MLDAMQIRARQTGMTLAELMITFAVLAIVITVAMPNMQSMFRNAQIRNAAEAILNGMQRARAEAVARNTNVAFTLGSDTGWTVSIVNPASVIEQRYAKEGSKDVSRNVQPPGATTITYNNLGQVAVNADGSAALTRVDLSDMAATAGTKDLRIVIGVSGNVRMCDPQLPSSDARGC